MTLHRSDVVNKPPPRAEERKRGLMETMIETVASGAGNTIGFG